MSIFCFVSLHYQNCSKIYLPKNFISTFMIFAMVFSLPWVLLKWLDHFSLFLFFFAGSCFTSYCCLAVSSLSSCIFCFPVFLHNFYASFILLSNTMLRYNSYSIKFTHIKCTIQLLPVHPQNCATFTTINFRVCSLSPKKPSTP